MKKLLFLLVAILFAATAHADPIALLVMAGQSVPPGNLLPVIFMSDPCPTCLPVQVYDSNGMIIDNFGGGGGGLTSVAVDAPLTGLGTPGSHIAMPAATNSVGGYLTSADHTTFAAKQSPLIFGSSLSNSGGTVTLSGDSGTPGNTKLYGTNASGVKGWYDQPAGGGGGATNFTGLADVPGNYTGASDQFVKVKTDETGLTFVPAPAGAGDVTGPSSSVDSELALFSSTSGKVIKRATGTGIPHLTSGVLSSTSTIATADIANNAVDFTKTQQIATQTVVGRSTAATGNQEALAVGAGILISGGTISNSGVTSITGTANRITASGSTGAITLSLPNTVNVNTSGNAATATTASALAANGSNCAAGQAAAGVDASGNAEGCFTPNGAGNVTGPGSSTANHLPQFSDTTGTLLKDGLAVGSTNTASAVVQRDASGNFSAGTITAALSGNASTATALAANGTNCTAGQFATGVDASGNAEGCATPAGGGNGDVLGPATNTANFIPQWNGANSKTLKDGLGVASANTVSTVVQRDASGNFSAGTITAALSGNATTASTATALAANGTNCTNQVPLGVDASGNAESCTTITSAYVNNSIALTGTDINTSNQVTATHLAAALPVNQGGTGTTSTLTGIMRGSASAMTAAELSGDVTTSGSNATTIANLAVTNAKIANSTIDLTTKVTGTLPLANMGQLFGTNAQTTTYQVLAADFVACKTITVASGTFTISLVAAGSQPAAGQCIKIINYGSGVVTIARSAQNINGGTSNLTLPASSATAPTEAFIVSNGTDYFASVSGATTVLGTSNQINASTSANATTLSLPTPIIDGSSHYCADAGSTDDYACTLTPAPGSYINGAFYAFKANTANTAAATINFNSLGAKTIKKVAGGVTTDLATNDIRVGQVVIVQYDGTNMQMQSMLGNVPSTSVPGSDTQVIFNDAGSFGADAGMTYNKTTDVLSVGGLVAGNCTTNCLTHDTSAVTGSKTVTWPNASFTVVGKDTGDVLTNKTLDAEGTGNVISMPIKRVYWAAGCNNATASTIWDLPTSTPAVAACVTGSNIQKGVLQFADTSGGFSAQMSDILPSDWTTTGGIDAVIVWRTGATTGNAKWSLSTACTGVGASATDDPAFNTANTATTAAPGTANRITTSTLTGLTITGCTTAAMQVFHLKLFRDGNDAADTIAATAEVLAVELTFRRAM